MARAKQWGRTTRAARPCDDIIDAACEAWNKLTASPEAIASIGMRDWAHVRQP